MKRKPTSDNSIMKAIRVLVSTQSFFLPLFAKESEGVAGGVGGGGGENLGHGGALGPGGNDRYVGTLPFLSLYIARVWSLI
jgi:hypothetical protein